MEKSINIVSSLSFLHLSIFFEYCCILLRVIITFLLLFGLHGGWKKAKVLWVCGAIAIFLWYGLKLAKTVDFLWDRVNFLRCCKPHFLMNFISDCPCWFEQGSSSYCVPLVALALVCCCCCCLCLNCYHIFLFTHLLTM